MQARNTLKPNKQTNSRENRNHLYYKILNFNKAAGLEITARQQTMSVQTDWGFDRSIFRLAGHVYRSHSIVLKMK